MRGEEDGRESRREMRRDEREEKREREWHEKSEWMNGGRREGGERR